MPTNFYQSEGQAEKSTLASILCINFNGPSEGGTWAAKGPGRRARHLFNSPDIESGSPG